MEFRLLRADEIEARVSTVSEKGCSVLLYKNARCDMNILDETVGPMNWQRDHKDLKGNMYAGIGIYDEERKIWVWKWDCGTESYTEAQKGEASDSFKRAGFNWGIGRELYTSPFIWFNADQINLRDGNNGKKTTFDTFYVDEIEYEDKKVSFVRVINKKTGAVYTHGISKVGKKKIDKAKINVLKKDVEAGVIDEDKLLNFFKVEKYEDITESQFAEYARKKPKK